MPFVSANQHSVTLRIYDTDVKQKTLIELCLLMMRSLIFVKMFKKDCMECSNVRSLKSDLRSSQRSERQQLQRLSDE